jgi:hypothetical protein
MTRKPPLVVLGAFLASVSAIAPSTVDAGNRGKHPVLLQVTRNTVGTLSAPKMRLERAESVVFVSDGDVLGPGTQTPQREIYFWHEPTNTIRRVTTSTGGESYDPARETDVTHSARPKFVAFVSTANLDPSVGNSDGNPEIFIYLSDTQEIRQVTDTPAHVVNAEPYSSDGGQCLVFRSNGDLDDNDGSDSGNPGAGFGNADGSDEIFMLRFFDNDLTHGVTTQVSNGPAGTRAEKPVIGGFWFTRQCRSTTWQSDHDQMNNGSSGIHLYNYTKQSGALEQLTPPGTAGIHRNPAITGASSFARGPFIVYESDNDVLGNGSTGIEIFRHRIFITEDKQYTYQAVGESRNPVVSDGGGHIAFESTSELINGERNVRGGGTPPFNADHNSEIFLAKGRTRIWQITESSGCENVTPTIQDNGVSVAFVSTCDLIPGLNPNGVPQLFVFQQMKNTDPRMSADGCKAADGCCNVASGCYRQRLGAQIRPPR